MTIEGGIDSPAEDEVCYGSFEVTGWAFSQRAPIHRVQVFFDGEFLGEARWGYRRPDVVATLSRVTEIDCGFGGQFLVQRPRGRGRLLVEITDAVGNKLSWERDISVHQTACGLQGPNYRPSEVDVEVLMLRLHKQIAESEFNTWLVSNGIIPEPSAAMRRS